MPISLTLWAAVDYACCFCNMVVPLDIKCASAPKAYLVIDTHKSQILT